MTPSVHHLIYPSRIPRPQKRNAQKRSPQKRTPQKRSAQNEAHKNVWLIGQLWSLQSATTCSIPIEFDHLMRPAYEPTFIDYRPWTILKSPLIQILKSQIFQFTSRLKSRDSERSTTSCASWHMTPDVWRHWLPQFDSNNMNSCSMFHPPFRKSKSICFPNYTTVLTMLNTICYKL